MPKHQLTIPVSPALQEAMGINPPREELDYYALFGLERTGTDATTVEAAVVERSRALRQWQSSPQFGDEVVALLKTLHRAARIMKDDTRREAYRDELEREERGETVSVTEEFTGLVRAAMADGQLSPEARKLLQEFVEKRGMPNAEAQRIIASVREELAAQRKAARPRPGAQAGGEAAGDGDDWEFRIAGTGEEGFALMLTGMGQTGELSHLTPAQLMAQAAKYKIPNDRAAQMIADSRREAFAHVVRAASGGRALNDHQAALLAAKASNYGLDQKAAAAIISEYTLSVHDPAMSLSSLSLADTFNQEEISNLIEEKHHTNIKHRRSLAVGIPDWLGSLVLIVLVGGGLIFGGIWAKENLLDKGTTGIIGTDPGAPGPGGSAPVAGSPGTTAGGKGTPAPGASPTPEDPNAADRLVRLPDPESGFLLLSPEQAGDPPAFEIHIQEVNNIEYLAFVRATLEPPPAGWSPTSYPPGTGLQPVTKVSWQSAKKYCAWLATQRGWAPESVDLPTAAEFRRALRGRAIRGNPSDPGYFNHARLGESAGLANVRQTTWDRVYFTGVGQVYDLLGNAAEWSSAEQGGERGILGGDFGQDGPGFDATVMRWAAPETMEGWLGFRVVHHPPGG